MIFASVPEHPVEQPVKPWKREAEPTVFRYWFPTKTKDEIAERITPHGQSRIKETEVLAPMLIGMGDSTPNGNLVGMQVNIPLVACGQIPQISIALRICTCASSDNLVFVYRNKHIGILADKHLEKLFIRRHKPPEAQPVGMFQYTIEATYVIIIYCKPY